MSSKNAKTFIDEVRRGSRTRVAWYGDKEGALTLSEIKALSSAMHTNAAVSELRIATLPRQGDPIALLMQGLENNALESLKLPHLELRPKDARKIVERIRGNTSLKTVAFNNSNLSDETVAILADGLATCPNLRHVNFCSTRAGEKSAPAIARMMRRLPRLETLDIGLTDIRAPATRIIAEALNDCPSLAVFDADPGETIGPEWWEWGEAIEQHFNASKSRNLVKCFPSSNETREIAHKNMHCSITAYTLMGKGGSDFGALSPFELGYSSTRIPAMRDTFSNEPDMRDRLEGFEAYLDGLPHVDMTRPVPLDALLEKDAQGRCALDNPRLWAECERWMPTLPEKLPLDVLLQAGHHGENYLTLALSTAPEAVIPALNKAGIALNENVLLDGRKASPAYESVIAHGMAPLLFTTGNWKGSPAAALQDAYAVLPDADKERITNYWRLQQELRAEELAVPTGKGR